MPTQYVVTDEELTAVANAIRTKGGTQSDLEWPSGFVNAVGDIAVGSGGGSIVQNPPIQIVTSSTSYPFVIKDGWISGFESSYNYFQPIDSLGNVIDCDWSNPFEICVAFKYLQTHTKSMVLFGSMNGFYYCPSIELSSNGGGLWCGFSQDGSTWTKAIAFNQNDDFSFQTNQKYTVYAKWDGTNYIVKITDGTNTALKSVETTAHYHNSNYRLEFGGINKSSNHNAKYVSMYLPDMYIMNHDIKIW